MTTQESFKRRIRARMAKTGERYGAARRTLLDQAAPRPGAWVSEPETSDDAVRAATGRSWDDWCTLIDRTPGPDAGHAAIAAHLGSHHDLDSWWAQTVTVGYERIRGLRLPYQMADGTFTASCSRTVTVDRNALRSLLIDEDGRSTLFPAFETELRSKPASKNVRLAAGGGTVEISLAPASGDRIKVSVAHTKLPSSDDVSVWKQFWIEWIEALDDAT